MEKIFNAEMELLFVYLMDKRANSPRTKIIRPAFMQAVEENDVIALNEWFIRGMAYFQACPKQGGLNTKTGEWSIHEKTENSRKLLRLYNLCEEHGIHLEFHDSEGKNTENNIGVPYITRFIKHSFAGLNEPIRR
jgi:hypothetical protein